MNEEVADDYQPLSHVEQTVASTYSTFKTSHFFLIPTATIHDL